MAIRLPGHCWRAKGGGRVSGLISTSDAVGIREALAVFLVHTCTLTPIVPELDGSGDPVLDEWGNPKTEPGTPQTNLPCKYAVKSAANAGDVRLIDAGSFLRRVPTLTVAHDLSVSVGDEVSAVTASDGTVLLDGPAVVEQVTLGSGFGPVITKRLVLRASGVMG